MKPKPKPIYNRSERNGMLFLAAFAVLACAVARNWAGLVLVLAVSISIYLGQRRSK